MWEKMKLSSNIQWISKTSVQLFESRLFSLRSFLLWISLVDSIFYVTFCITQFVYKIYFFKFEMPSTTQTIWYLYTIHILKTYLWGQKFG